VTHEGIRVDTGRLRRFVSAVYEDAGLSPQDAAVAAEAMVRTDERGQPTHGVWFLPTYCESLRNGAIRADAKPRILRETPGTAVLDGDDGLGAVVAVRACEIAARKAREVGVATVLVRNGNHFGAAGYFSLWLAEQGLFGIVAANTAPVVGAPGARRPVIGTQPISYCAPAPDEHGPVMLDMALSVVAANRILQAEGRGESIPEGWLNDPDGEPTTDPSRFLQGGALLPMGGHKGYGLGILVEILAAVLSGAAMGSRQTENFEAGRPADIGHWISAFDIDAFMPREEFAARLADLREHVHAVPTAHGAAPLILPGEPEWRHELDTRVNGLELGPDIWSRLVAVAEGRGLAGLLTDAVRR
jgi:LDH2 family malate/lactate/ureidoglycolate dehydrogenase